MKKAVYHGIRDVRVEEVAEPLPGAGEIKVQVVYCGLCGSDLHEYLHGPFPASPFGHEVCGRVVQTGEGVLDYSVGDHVVTFVRDGYAQFLVAPVDRAMKIPADISWERAAVLEPLAGAVYALEKGNLRPSQSVFIAGAGPVGLLVLLAAKTLGVEKVFMSDLSRSRRDKALELGATEVFDPGTVKIPGAVRDLTGGGGADVSVEAVGIEATLKDCLASTAFGGTVVVQGIFTERAMVHMLGFVTKEITMIGTNSINADRALQWLTTTKIRPESIITSIVPLEKIVADGFEALASRREGEIKILIQP